MAEYALIDGYLDALRTQVRWRKDVEDLVAEVEDHLYSTVERFEARGTDPKLAQRQTLERFGDPELMAEAFASTPQGGIAVPTKFTRNAGLAALVASALWIVATAVYGLWSDYFFDWNSSAYMAFSVFIMAAGALTFVASLGLRVRHGGLGGLGSTGVAIAGIGVLLSFVTWALPVWMAVQGAGYLLVALTALPMKVAPRAPTIGYGSGLLVGTATFVVLNMLKVGPIDSYGDYPLAWFIGGAVGFVITSVGLLGIGLWLRGEEPAPVDTPDPAVTT